MSFVSKNTAEKIWNFFDEATPVFLKLSDQPTTEDVKKAMPTINRFTVLLYNKTSNSKKFQDGKYTPHWTELPEASIAIRDLVRCRCNPEKGCKGRCKCLSAELPCTELCLCNGDCERDD